jgi:hypothetical protein
MAFSSSSAALGHGYRLELHRCQCSSTERCSSGIRNIRSTAKVTVNILLVPAMNSSFRYPMVTYCQESNKLCVGTKTGVLALYDLKSPKNQVSGVMNVESRTFISHFLAAISSASEE